MPRQRIEMSEHYIVDGYNVIHAWREDKKIEKMDFEHTRDKLIDIISDFVAATSTRATIVFDAHLVKSGVEHVEKINNVMVYYTKYQETADALIERLVGEFTKKSRVYVITSDWDEQRVIFGKGAYRLTPKEFYRLIACVKSENRRCVLKAKPADDYLENQLQKGIKDKLEQMRRGK
ncbi:NYN domain-containing protein [Peptococcaceae bacterium]|nr:NYN domain-containing protein [Peptococcaceae bacterium]MCL0100393.1 NYN domain-containing protein [Peptococcaceae bacterium]